MAAEFISKPSIKSLNEGEEDYEDQWDDTLLIQAWNQSWTKMKEAVDGGFELPIIGKGDKCKQDKQFSYGKNKKEKRGTANFVSKWKINDMCLAIWDEDGFEYTAKILDINPDTHSCEVLFTDYGNSDIVDMDNIRPIELTFPFNNSSFDDNSEDASLSDATCPPKVASTAGRPKTGTTNGNTSFTPQTAPKHGGYQGSGGKAKTEPRKKPHKIAKQSQSPDLLVSSDGAYSRPYTSYTLEQPGTDDHTQDDSDVNGVGSSFNGSSGIPNLPFNLLSGGSKGDVEKEALASMLISWYMTGYHTGFYQGLQQCACKQQESAKKGVTKPNGKGNRKKR